MIGNTKNTKDDNLIKFNPDNRGTLLFDFTGNVFNSTEFGIIHNLYAYNAEGIIESNNYTGNGTTQTVA